MIVINTIKRAVTVQTVHSVHTVQSAADAAECSCTYQVPGINNGEDTSPPPKQTNKQTNPRRYNYYADNFNISDDYWEKWSRAMIL